MGCPDPKRQRVSGGGLPLLPLPGLVWVSKARRRRVFADRPTVVTRHTADRPNTQSLPFQLDDFVHVSPPEHLRTSAPPLTESRRRSRYNRLADFSIGIMQNVLAGIDSISRTATTGAMYPIRQPDYAKRLPPVFESLREAQMVFTFPHVQNIHLHQAFARRQ